MDDIKLDALIIILKNSTIKNLKESLQRGSFDALEIPYVEAWIKEKEKEPKRTLINIRNLLKNQLNKITKASIFIKSSIMVPLFRFWCKEYKWILGSILTLIGLYLTYLMI